MPNPIIIIFEYHRVPAGELLFQYNVPALIKEGYKTYLDEEASNMTLIRKQSLSNDLVIEAQSIPEEDEEIWQKEMVITRKKTLDLLVQNQFNYHAYDLPEAEIKVLLRKNLDVLKSHPKGMAQGMNDLLSGKIPNRKEVYERRVAFQNEEFAKHAIKAPDGVICSAGIYHANHLQSYLRTKFPGQDILSYFPYQGAAFEPFEDTARNPELNATIFPHRAKIINLDNNLDEAKTLISNDVAIYKNTVLKLETIERALTQDNIPTEQLDEILEELKSLKNNCQKLKSLNNLETYLFAIDVYMLKCAIEKKDFSYIKANYNALKKTGDSLVKTEFKEILIKIVKEIVSKYQAEQKAVKTKPAESNNYNPQFFGENTSDQSQVTSHIPAGSKNTIT